MSFVDDGAEFVEGEGRHIVEHSVGTQEVAAIGINLDPIDSVADLLAHGAASALDAIDLLHTLGHARLDLPRVVEDRVSAGDVHGAAGDLHARPGNDSGSHGFAKIDV